MILTYPNKTLGMPTAEVVIGSGFDMQEVDYVIDCMIHTMYLSRGLGLAANQIGEDKSIFVYDDDGNPRVIVNPEVVTIGELDVTDDESCLSVPFFSAKIKRASEIMVGGLDMDFEPTIVRALGLTARVFQHELDHLNGITVLDRASQMHRERYRNRLKKMQRRQKRRR